MRNRKEKQSDFFLNRDLILERVVQKNNGIVHAENWMFIVSCPHDMG